MWTTVQLSLALCVGLAACRPDVAGTDAGPIMFAPGDPVWGLTGAQRNLFGRGRLVFNREFTPETGLGPRFNSTSCAECHEDPLAGGRGDEIEVHATAYDPAGDVCDDLAAQGGPVIQQQATPALQAALGITQEPFPPGAARAFRATPTVFGRGLLDAVPDAEILGREDPDDRDGDGISGRPNRTADGRVGRFGRKANFATLREFNAGAFLAEQGITNPEQPAEGTIGGAAIPPGVDPVGDPEIDQATLDQALAQHGGEAAGARDRFEALSPADSAALIMFLKSL